MTGGTEARQAHHSRIQRIERTTHWHRDSDSDAFRADLIGGVSGHIFNVRPGKWEWWISTGHVLDAGVATNVVAAQRAAIAAAVAYVQIGHHS